jgi:membrane-associated phospholipid phosphatase
MLQSAKIISFLLHPLWMPLITLIIAFGLDPFLGIHPKAFLFLLSIVLVNILVPGITILFMVKRKMISNLEISERTERWIPFLLVFGYYLLTYVLLRTRADHFPIVVNSFFFGLLLSLGLAVIINNFTKISIHMLAFGGMLGSIAALNVVHYLNQGFVIAILLLLGAAVAWARLTLGVHTQRQVYFGFSLGFLIHFYVISYGVFV